MTSHKLTSGFDFYVCLMSSQMSVTQNQTVELSAIFLTVLTADCGCASCWRTCLSFVCLCCRCH